MRNFKNLFLSVFLLFVALRFNLSANLVTDYVFTQNYDGLTSAGSWNPVPFYNWDPCAWYTWSGQKVCGNTKMFPIGFTFNYDCQDFTEVSVNASGVLVFGDYATPYEYGDGYYTAYFGEPEKCNWDGNGYLKNMLIPWGQYDAVDPSVYGGSVQYQTQGVAPNRVFIVQWYSQYYYDWMYGWYGGLPQDFEVRLYEGTNKIEFVYGKNCEYGYGYTSLCSMSGDGSAKTISNYYYGYYDWYPTYGQYYNAALYYGYDYGYGRSGMKYEFTPCLALNGRTGTGNGGFANMNGTGVNPPTPPLLFQNGSGVPLPKTNVGAASSFKPIDLCVTDPACGYKYFLVEFTGGTNSSEFAIYPNNANAVYYFDGSNWNYNSVFAPNPALVSSERGIHPLPGLLADSSDGLSGAIIPQTGSMILEVIGGTCVQPIIQFRPKCAGVRNATIRISSVDYPGAPPSGCYNRSYILGPESAASLTIPNNLVPFPSPAMPPVLVGTSANLPNLVFSNTGAGGLKLYSIDWFNYTTNTWTVSGTCPSNFTMVTSDATNQFSILNTSTLNGVAGIPSAGTNINSGNNLTLKIKFAPTFDGLQKAKFRIRIGCECFEYNLQMTGSAPGGTFVAKINGVDVDLNKVNADLFKGVTVCGGEGLVVIPIKVTNISSVPFQILGINLFENDTVIGQGTTNLTRIDPLTSNLMISKDYLITRAYPKLPFSSNIPATPFTMPNLNDTTTIYLSFNPQSYGKRYGKLIFCTNGYFNPSSKSPYIATKNGPLGLTPCGSTRGVLALDLYGNGTGAILSKNLNGEKLTEVMMPDTRLNESTEKWVKIYNTGSKICDLNVSNFELTVGDVDDIKEFEIVKRPTNPIIKYGKSDSFLVRFSPKTTGTRSTVLFIKSNDVRPFNPMLDVKGINRVLIEGNGLPGVYNEREYEFADALIGGNETQPTKQLVEFVNNSLKPVMITGLKITGTDSLDFKVISNHSFPLNLLPADKLGIDVAFSPDKNSTPGLKKAVLEVSLSNSSVVKYSLYGVAVTRTLSITKAVNPLLFGSVSINTVVRKTVFLTNTGTSDVAIRSIVVSGVDAKSFTLGKVARLVLEPNMSVPLEISFLPTSSGAKSAKLVVSSNATNGDQELMLQGLTSSNVKRGDSPYLH